MKRMSEVAMPKAMFAYSTVNPRVVNLTLSRNFHEALYIIDQLLQSASRRMVSLLCGKSIGN